MILNKDTAGKKLRRMAMEVAERNFDKPELIIIGIRENGIFIAERIASHLKELFPGSVQLLDLWMDKKHPLEIRLSEAINFNNKCILLVDDVANSGRTLLYALKPLLDAHPAQIETLVLVERTYKKFPVSADYVGLTVSTTSQENIVVSVENGEVTGAYLAV